MANTRIPDMDSTDFSTRVGRTIKEYTGFAKDEKPFSTDAATLPFGSTFYEVDTKRSWVWDGYAWNLKPDYGPEIVRLLGEILEAVRDSKEIHFEQLAEMQG
jgi:hypothetical protein